MTDFQLYFKLGTDHILTWEALDHLLFITALCLRYLLPEWKRVFVLVTAFTIGHSLTLALAAMDFVRVAVPWIEFLIPITIAITAAANLVLTPDQIKYPQKLPVIYFLALIFGLIHGLAYATTFMSLEGKERLLPHILAFNLGIEIAQLCVVVIILLLSYLFVIRFRISRIFWVKFISAGILISSLIMAFQRFPH